MRRASGVAMSVWAVFASAAFSMAGAADQRTWTDSSGKFRVDAEFVDFQDGTVQLKRADGNVISIPLERLSSADQAFVRQMAAASPRAADPLAPSPDSVVIELTAGGQLEGRITNRSEESITLEVRSGARTLRRDLPVDRIRAVTVGGTRTVLQQAAGTSSAPSAARAPAGSTRVATRSREEVDRLIDEMGRTTPDWWEATELSYPETLDLSWPEKPEPPWNPQKNVGQFLWDIIYPNSQRWREGVKFVHFMLDRHKNDPAKRQRAMETLGHVYHVLLHDYARAAFWWRQAGIERSADTPQGVSLAECFWRLGNKQMALEFLDRNTKYFTTIKLWADMGETRRAIQLAEAASRGGYGDFAFLYAGDACRIEGQYDRAISYYERVIAMKPQGNEGEVHRIERNQQRARANIEAIRIFDTLDLRRVPDGTYRASSAAYAGDLRVEVSVRGGRIETVRVTEHKEKQYYGALTETPAKIIQKQGVKGVDATTSATITSEAIINATAKALASALK